jgi:catechol 2,3-dioxygenase-like lactoylglutathione lyase family enzyme|tara:strand:- start:2849 stop:3652 length:804 start_codon:yes stop_codon:yes gene_type:complete
MQTNHLNIVLSATDVEKTHEFYGEILGLQRMPDIPFPDGGSMVRYLGGDTEIKFLFRGNDLPVLKGGATAARGIRLMAVLLPIAKKDAVVKGLKTHAYAVPTFTKGTGFEYGMAYDHDGNQVEVVFLAGGVPESAFKQFQIGLTVGDTDAMNSFLREVMGYEELEPAPIGGGAIKYSYKVGNSTVKFWSFGDELPIHVGSPSDIVGMTLVQHIVPDVDAVRKTIVQRGGKIHTEPFPLGKMATIMFVEGPDGILFEFAGPLLERFKQ